MEIRELNLKDPWVKTFGTIDGGLELMNAAWVWLIFPFGWDGFGRVRRLICNGIVWR
jgi:hypothetical protein